MKFTTFTGRRLNFDDIKPEDIAVADIANGLANTCRFHGQCNNFYSVAQHSVLMCHVIETNYHGEVDALLTLRRYALLHDAAEAYLGDLSVIVKHRPDMENYRALEAIVQHTIYRKFGLSRVEVPAAVHDIDERIILDEAANLGLQLQPRRPELTGYGLRIFPIAPKFARHAWMEKFRHLFPGVDDGQ